MNALHWAFAAAARGTDVYLFLIGMMGIAAYAHINGVFDRVAALTVRIAGASRLRLFALVYIAGIVTTAFFSNDATIVVLTPAVIGVLRRYDSSPVPYVVACALIANAASFLLPISNPSNLLVFAGHIPALGGWLRIFGLPSVGAVAVTFAVLAWFYRRELRDGTASEPETATAATPIVSIVLLAAAAAAIVTTSALAGPLGATTCACAVVMLLATLSRDRTGARTIVREISWRVIVLTAALFIVITAADDAGGFALTRAALAWCAALAAPWSMLATGFLTAVASNAVNNLPVGLNLGETLPAMHADLHTATAALIGVNLGPNATVNGSLATILWLTILKRENIAMSWLAFARIGLLTTLPALAAALLLVYASS